MMTKEDIINKANRLPRNIQFKAEFRRKYSNVSFRVEIIEVDLESLFKNEESSHELFKRAWREHRDNDSYRFFNIIMMELIDDIPGETYIYMNAAMDPTDFVRTYAFMINITKCASKINNHLRDCKFDLSWARFGYHGAAFFKGSIRNKELFFKAYSTTRPEEGDYTRYGFDCNKTIIEQFTWDGQTMGEQLALRLK